MAKKKKRLKVPVVIHITDREISYIVPVIEAMIERIREENSFTDAKKDEEINYLKKVQFCLEENNSALPSVQVLCTVLELVKDELDTISELENGSSVHANLPDMQSEKLYLSSVVRKIESNFAQTKIVLKEKEM